MPQNQVNTIRGIRNQGQDVPVVAFYSVSGGVGKSTLARKFAELVTVAPGLGGQKPNVLLIDLDVESSGLTFRLAKGLGRNCRTVHEIIAERNVAAAQAMTVTTQVSLASGNLPNRGQLYLMPAAPPEAKKLFDTIAEIDRSELYGILLDMINALVIQYNIACVVIDCAPGANPYTAAAATLASFPFLVGRNETTTYEQIRLLPERFREWYDQFQPAKQRVIINAVSVKELYDERAKQYAVFDYIPLTSDVIHVTEGLPHTETLQMLLFEKYIVDIIKQVFVGMNHLIPEAPEVVGQEWIETLYKLEHCEEAPKVRHLRNVSRLRWVGAVIVLIGIALIGSHRVFENLPAKLADIGIPVTIAGVAIAAAGWYAESNRQRILTAARDLVFGGAEGIFRKLKAGATDRKALDEMKRVASTIRGTSRR